MPIMQSTTTSRGHGGARGGLGNGSSSGSSSGQSSGSSVAACGAASVAVTEQRQSVLTAAVERQQWHCVWQQWQWKQQSRSRGSGSSSHILYIREAS